MSRITWSALVLSVCLAGTTRGQDAPLPDLKKQIDDALKQLEKAEEEAKKAEAPAPINPRGNLQGLDIIEAQRRMLDELLRGNPGLLQGPGLEARQRALLEAMVLGRRGLTGPARLGAIVTAPPPVVVDQLDLPAGIGLVVQEVVPTGPAAKAGLKKHDILVELGGKSVPSDLLAFQTLLRDLKPGEIDATVLRKGRKEQVKGIVIADQQRASALGAPPFRGIQAFGGNNESVSVSVVNDEFTIRYVSDTVKAKILGTRLDGQTKVTDIQLQDGDAKHQAASIAELPERYRATMSRLVGQVK